MKSKSTSYIFILFFILFFSSCKKSEIKEDKTILFLEKIEKLKEYKKAQKKVDSLNKIGIKSELTISILKNSFFDSDSLKNSYSAIVNENSSFSSKIVFIVQYHKDTFEILSIKPNK